MKITMRRFPLRREENRKMNLRMPGFNRKALLPLSLFLAVGFFVLVPTTLAQTKAQSTYSSPDQAMEALITAVRASDGPALSAIFGPEFDQLLSGDEVEDADDLAEFADAIGESAKLQKVSDAKYIMIVGKNNYPGPIPMVQKDGNWLFDTKAGLDEILSRRIGDNELSAINTCRAYAIAQWEYFTEGDWDNDGVAEYAQRLFSAPGKHDGLFWETPEGEKPSPLGKLVAAAREEGYGPKPRKVSPANPAAKSPSNSSPEKEATVHPRAPYHGYYFKILKAQGAYAPGGKFSYLINGNMIAGYALVAYPDKWGNSGVMTFIINQQGRVYQQDLGPDTVKLAAAFTEYNPDPTWKLVVAQP
jgi:hypothetical protein